MLERNGPNASGDLRHLAGVPARMRESRPYARPYARPPAYPLVRLPALQPASLPARVLLLAACTQDSMLAVGRDRPSLAGQMRCCSDNATPGTV